MHTTPTAPSTDHRRTLANVEKLRGLALIATVQHGEAIRAGGYTTSHGDEVLPTDPAEFSNEDLATFYTLAAQLIEGHLLTQRHMTPAVEKFVSRVLGYAGVQA